MLQRKYPKIENQNIKTEYNIRSTEIYPDSNLEILIRLQNSVIYIYIINPFFKTILNGIYSFNWRSLNRTIRDLA